LSKKYFEKQPLPHFQTPSLFSWLLKAIKALLLTAKKFQFLFN
jgi:hypothetical protein